MALSPKIAGIIGSITTSPVLRTRGFSESPLEALRIRGNVKEGWFIRRSWIFGALLLAISIVILIQNPFPYDVQFRMGSVVVFSLFIGGTLIIPGSVGLWERLLRPFIRVLYGSSGRIGSSNIQRAKLRTTLTDRKSTV